MASLFSVKSLHAFLFLILSQAYMILAQSTSVNSTPTSAAVSTSAPSSDGGSCVEGGCAGDTAAPNTGPTNAAGENAAGASGGQGGSVNISEGSIIAIVVVVCVVVLLGATSAVLFFIAKKRQWQVRKSIRRSVRRVTTGLARPKTPKTPRSKPMSLPPPQHASSFSSTASREKEKSSLQDIKGNLKIDTSPTFPRSVTPNPIPLPPALAAKAHKKQLSLGQQQQQQREVRSRSQERSIDSEKGLGSGRREIRRPPMISTQSSAFDMDSPIKSPVWTRIFGKK